MRIPPHTNSVSIHRHSNRDERRRDRKTISREEKLSFTFNGLLRAIRSVISLIVFNIMFRFKDSHRIGLVLFVTRQHVD